MAPSIAIREGWATGGLSAHEGPVTNVVNIDHMRQRAAVSRSLGLIDD
jgi:hypothetical protein